MSSNSNRESPTCPISGASNSRMLCEVDGYKIWRCPDSATDFVWPMPDAKLLNQIYHGRDWFEGGLKGGYQDYDHQTEGLLPFFEELLSEYENEGPGRSILDIGCGYGNHLARAAARGWKSFGVEVSEHARQIAKQRHGNHLFIVDDVEKLIPHEFDVIILFDVIEHLRDPYALFYKLFSKGAIVPKTNVVITTPNARSYDAIRDPAGWAYRHPPSHLVYYSAKSLEILLRRLHFKQIEVSGIHPVEAANQEQFEDEVSVLNRKFAGFAGLLSRATGSDFKEFMHERYVPGTWSKLAEYEHLPRYVFAKTMAEGARVLDFGCGTGYGTAILAESAQSVLGVDIDTSALQWASENHLSPKLKFEQRSDLGEGLPKESFDIITCFEVIEHVDGPTQMDLVRSLSRLLAPNGKLIISTPNPEVTANYGENPYHLREMTQEQFEELLSPDFKYVRIFQQWVRPSVSIVRGAPFHPPFVYGDSTGAVAPLAYVAICSNQKVPDALDFFYLDGSVDYVARHTAAEADLHAARYENYRLTETLQNQELHIKNLESAARQLREASELHIKNLESAARQLREASELHIAGLTAQITEFRGSKIYRLRDAVRQPFSLGKVLRIGYLLAAMATPRFVREKLRPITLWLKENRKTQPTTLKRPSGVISRPQRAARLNNSPSEKVSIVIPTLNAGPLFRDVLEGIRRQKFSRDLELLIVDSGSTDETLKLAWADGAKIIEIDPQTFNHGASRNNGIENTRGDIAVLLTQDAVPGDENLISNLVRPFEDPEVAGCYGRQVPRPEADVLTTRKLNEWLTGGLQSRIVWIEEVEAYEALTPFQRYSFCNFDNVCSAVRKSVWKEIPFPARNFGEDIAWGMQAIEQGWKIAYEPAAWVVHSHDRPIAYEFKRTYLCHRALCELFGLRTVPSRVDVVRAVVGSIRDDWRYTFRNERDLQRRLALLAQIPFLNAATAYGQYRGARDAHTERGIEYPEV